METSREVLRTRRVSGAGIWFSRLGIAALAGALLAPGAIFGQTTTTTLSSSPNPSVLGQPVTLQATVAASGGFPVNGGFVTFYDGVTILGTSTVFNGQTQVSTAALPSGPHSLKALYFGSN